MGEGGLRGRSWGGGDPGRGLWNSGGQPGGLKEEAGRWQPGFPGRKGLEFLPLPLA